jgi:hypothetical protein
MLIFEMPPAKLVVDLVRQFQDIPTVAPPNQSNISPAFGGEAPPAAARNPKMNAVSAVTAHRVSPPTNAAVYAHYDTGRYTDAPRQIVPGQPALAGRNLTREMTRLAIDNRVRSSVSLSAMAEDSSSISGQASSFYSPGTASPLGFTTSTSPSPLPSPTVSADEVARLNDIISKQNELINIHHRTLASQQSQLSDAWAENSRLRQEIDILRATVSRQQYGANSRPAAAAISRPSTPLNAGLFAMRHPSAGAAAPRVSSSPATLSTNGFFSNLNPSAQPYNHGHTDSQSTTGFEEYAANNGYLSGLTKDL